MFLLNAPLELKSLDDKGSFEGYGSTFGNVDFGNDVCVKGCFVDALKSHQKSGTLPAMYWMHDPKEPIGDWIEMTEDARGLHVKGKLWLDTEASRKAYNLLKGTGSKGLSIGYKTKQQSRDAKTGVRSLIKVDLPEVSVVGYGMNPDALVTRVKSDEDAYLKSLVELADAALAAQIDLGMKMEMLAKINKVPIRDGTGKYQTLLDYMRGTRAINLSPITV